MKTAELAGAALDWAVAKCEKKDIRAIGKFGVQVAIGNDYDLYAPSKYWAHGGPIIEREKLCVGYSHQPDPSYHNLLDPEAICWARTTAGGFLKAAPTPLIAAMRCYVASKLGEEIEIPEGLKCK